ncbi:hypothetical protein TCAL_08944 [Tigriopus californicus]|uniref:Amine oxidase n=1 Tax=Tigriopus californicus TaxID=6832 RepID=A0A553PPJ3_TIGCA|nr:probable flavin-containing monoamine oxidase A isoform X2 [Tigriopus californicus]TRY79586.1 hypothetical protein TCAL_08944 [Tigriopus californicus]|eukprot:TCALIF_08944-PA protein Name:"Similar to MAOA Amine oxidase [flavin-containing] A (Bos taurus)" AED:0.06 eAED:0.06 QI:29/1/1/1/1/1/5/215/545
MESTLIKSDVIIIGAGLAGLTAAHELKKKDDSLNVMILEANSRVGGRLFSKEVLVGGQNVSIELGGQFLTSTQTELLDLLADLQLDTLELAGTPFKQLYFCSTHCSPLWRTGAFNATSGFKGWVRQFEWVYLLNRLKNYESAILIKHPYIKPKLAEYLDTISLHGFLRDFCYFASNRDMFEIVVLRIFGRSSTEISLLMFLIYSKSMGGVHELFGPTKKLAIAGGSAALLDRLAKTIGVDSIVTNQPVQCIVTDDEKVYVTSSTQQIYVCQRVICAIPPEHLPMVQFEPNLGPKMAKSVKSWSSGNMIKFVVVYSRPFWKDHRLSGTMACLQGKQIQKVCSGLPITQVFDASLSTNEDDPGILSGLLAGPAALQWGEINPETLKLSIIETLSEYFGHWAQNETHHIELHYWDQEIFSSSPICSQRLGCLEYAYTLRDPHQDKVFFAGAELSVQWMGQMAGAVLSGTRAAIQVLDDLRPQSLSTKDYKVLKSIHLSTEDRFPKHVQSSRNYGIYRWTLFLPMTCIAFGYGACFLRDKWCGIFIPMH